MIEFQNQLYVVLQSFLFGCFLNVVYEIHSSFTFLLGLRRAKNKYRFIKEYMYASAGMIKRILVVISDISYFLCISPICAIFLFGVNCGILRWYIGVAAALGFGLFKISFGRCINYVLDLLVLLFKACVTEKVKKAVKRFFSRIKKNKRKDPKAVRRTVLISIKGKQG